MQPITCSAPAPVPELKKGPDAAARALATVPSHAVPLAHPPFRGEATDHLFVLGPIPPCS